MNFLNQDEESSDEEEDHKKGSGIFSNEQFHNFMF